MHPAPRPGQGQQAQVHCGGCRILLQYPAGAQNVRCARCAHITYVPPTAGTHDMAQLTCSGCRTSLLYPRGALQVQCSLCGAMNDATTANQLAHIACGGCHIMLMYQVGARSVKCAVCNHVTPAASVQHTGPYPPTMHPHHQHHHMPQPMLAGMHPATMPPPMHQQSAPPRQQRQRPGDDGVSGREKGSQAVLVENPPSVDESGKEIEGSLALGISKKKESRPKNDEGRKREES